MRALIGASAGIVLCAGTYAHWPAQPLPDGAHADSVLVYKSQRKLILLDGGKPLKEYRVALGDQAIGAKREEGDEKTPEGTYTIDYRNPNSSFHLALHISYPNARDKSEAAARGVPPGGLIMIHGIRNGLGFLGRIHRLLDWTDGCIAVTNGEIGEIARVVADGTPIEIRP